MQCCLFLNCKRKPRSEMPVEIRSSTVKKLCHENEEIRIRTLMQIQSKLTRALTHNEEIEFKPVELMIYLVKWFGQTPLQYEEVALEMILTLAKSRHFKDITETLRIPRLQKEVEKISLIIGTEEAHQLLRDIRTFLAKHNQPEPDVIELSDSDSYQDVEDEMDAKDYVPAWSVIAAPDYNLLKLINERITDNQNESKLRCEVLNLGIKLSDYPAEYFLQPPYIFKTLIGLIDSPGAVWEQALEVFIKLVRLLSGRIKLRNSVIFQPADKAVLTGVKQISVEKFCGDLFTRILERLKVHLFEYNKQDYLTFQLLLQLMEFLEEKHCPNIPIESHFKELSGFAGKLYSALEEPTNASICRIKYLNIIFILTRMAKYYKKSNGAALDTKELRRAVLDVSLMHTFPKPFEDLKSYLDETQKIVLQQFPTSLAPVVDIIRRDPEAINDEEMLNQADAILDTMCIHKSQFLVQKIVNAVFNCVSLYDMNSELQKKAKKTLLRCFLLEDVTIKAHVYNDTANWMKRYFAGLMDGQKQGLPLTCQVLAEIITSSAEHSDPVIVSSSAVILCLILKGVQLLGQTSWGVWSEIISPNLPLLQCIQLDPSLDMAVLRLIDPDSNLEISFLDLIQGNIRYLFHPEAITRSEALSRLIYILTVADRDGEFKPDILAISDTLPNDICLLPVPREPDRIFFPSNHKDRQSVLKLLALLNNPSSEPVVRKNVLMQLNVICQDENLIRFVIDDCGWFPILEALDSSLRTTSHSDYTDTSIPATGILSKLVLKSKDFRCFLSNELEVYIVLLRALFMYHTDLVLQQDASLALFLLSHSAYITGGKMPVLPQIMKNLKLPIKCEFQQKCITNQTQIEKAFCKMQCKRFFRIAVAELWCGSFQNILPMRPLKNKKKLNPELQLVEADYEMIRYTSVEENIKEALTCISNATKHSHVLKSISKIKTCLLNRLKNVDVDTEEIVGVLKKFLLMSPATELDTVLFKEVVSLLHMFILAGHNGIFNWVLDTVNGRKNSILNVLNHFDVSIALYEKIATFLGELVLRSDDQDFRLDLYKFIVPITEKCFKQRQLDCLRCLLKLMELLTHSQIAGLNESDCKQFMYFLISLKCVSQMGSELQKRCLTIIGNLSSRSETMCLHQNYLNYLSGLCGHQDFQLRVLAWSCVQIISDSRQGADLLVETLAQLPGGFQASCLSILMDVEEVSAVRTIAGSVLANLINGRKEEVVAMLTKYRFFESIISSLKVYHTDLDPSNRKLTTPEVVRVYCTILVNLRLDVVPEKILFRLAELLKKPCESECYVQMCSEICNLFLSLKGEDKNLTAILCQDQSFVGTLCSILTLENADKSSILKYLMLLARDKYAFQFICEYISNNKIHAFLIESITSKKRHAQLTGISFCAFLLIKSQLNRLNHISFSDILDCTVIEEQCLSERIFTEFEKIFLQEFTGKSTDFYDPPTNRKTIVSEALAALLKTSPKARKEAHKKKLLPNILKIVNTFFQTVNMSCAIFIRKYGDSKKVQIVRHLKILFGIVLNWFCVDTVPEEDQAIELCKAIQRTWSWLTNEKTLKELVLKTLSFLTSSSIAVCKQMSSQSILPLVAKLAVEETNKIKLQNADLVVLKISLSTLSNCCCTHEGRTSLIKQGVMDVFDRFYPLDNKGQRTQFAVINLWLQFWELLSRYPEGGTCRNLVLLGTLVHKSPDNRLLCLKLFRNMCFVQSNRSALLTSTDILYNFGSILSTGTVAERLIVCTGIWKLTSGNCKAKSLLKGTGIPKLLKYAQQELIADQSSDPQKDDLLNVIEIVQQILYD